MGGNTVIVTSTSLILALATLLRVCLCEPSKLDKATLECLENGLAARFADEKPPSEIYKAFVPADQKELSKKWQFTTKKIDPRKFQVEQKTHDNGVSKFDTLIVTQGTKQLPVHDTDIAKATSQCPSLHPQQVCDVVISRILSQASIKAKPFTGLLSFIASVAPQKPICEEEFAASDSFTEEYHPEVIPVPSRLTAMQDVFRQCVTEITKTHLLEKNHPEIAIRRKTVGGTAEAAAANLMVVGERAFFGCNWFVRKYNVVINKTSQLGDIVQQAWITDCMREQLPTVIGINAQQFKEAYGASNDPEKVEQLNSMITGIRCAPPSIDAALDINTELRILGGPAWQKAKHTYESLKDYISCFKAEYKTSKSSLGELIGCNEKPGLYEKTRKCAAEAAKTKQGEFRLDFPATGADLQKVMENTTMFKTIYGQLCRLAGQMSDKTRQTRGTRDTHAKQTRETSNPQDEFIWEFMCAVFVFCVFVCVMGIVGFIFWLTFNAGVVWIPLLLFGIVIVACATLK